MLQLEWNIGESGCETKNGQVTRDGCVEEDSAEDADFCLLFINNTSEG